MTKKRTAKRDVKKRQQEFRQASAAVSILGVLGLVAVIVASFKYEAEVPGIVYGIFAAIIVPPEVLKRILKAVIGGDK